MVLRRPVEPARIIGNSFCAPYIPCSAIVPTTRTLPLRTRVTMQPPFAMPTQAKTGEGAFCRRHALTRVAKRLEDKVKDFLKWLAVGVLAMFAARANAQAPNSFHLENKSALPANPDLHLDIRAVDATVKAGSPLTLNVILTNTSEHEIALWLSKAGAEGTYQVDIHDEKEGFPPDTKYGRLHNGHIDSNDPEYLKSLGYTEQELLNTGANNFPFTLQAVNHSHKTSLSMPITISVNRASIEYRLRCIARQDRKHLSTNQMLSPSL
jgi:hypothetical protein